MSPRASKLTLFQGVALPVALRPTGRGVGSRTCSITVMFHYESTRSTLFGARWMRSDSKPRISLEIRWAAILPLCSRWRTRSG